jgi:NAD(P)-dependent dehydrogenase (short-subunit alcohol dehydrogenase family)
VLVNAAGVSTGALLHELTDDDFDFVFGINFRAPMKGMQAVIRALLAEGKPGSIVNISSVGCVERCSADA